MAMKKMTSDGEDSHDENDCDESSREGAIIENLTGADMFVYGGATIGGGRARRRG